MSLNFRRRYKWLCAPTPDNEDALLFDLPSLQNFHEDVNTIRQVGMVFSYQRVPWLIASIGRREGW